MAEGTRPRILAVDDDREIRRQLVKALGDRGFDTVAVESVAAAETVLAERRIDLVLLDIMMPGRSGLDFCRALRARSDIPIILLTALGEEADRVIGLEFGADDYVCKPFSTPELVARIRAQLRRAALLADGRGEAASGYAFEGWRLDVQRRELTDPEGALVDLTGAEFDLLLVLVERAGRVLSRDALLDLTRGRDYDAFDRSVDILISRLRRKLGDSARAPRLIKTVHATGYVLAAETSPL